MKARRSAYRRRSFVETFATSSGPPQIVLLCFLLAFAIGSTIGVVPAVMTDRYARLNHGFMGSKDCASYGRSDKPDECISGGDDAQNAAAVESLLSNMLTFVTSSIVGSISDMRGRKGVMLTGIFLSLLGPSCLVLIQILDSMSPTWYYAARVSTGLVSWIAVALSALSDVMPQKWRAPSFGLLLAGFSCGFAFSPILALSLSHFGVSVLSLVLLFSGFLFALFFLPETLPHELSEEARTRSENSAVGNGVAAVIRVALPPIKELSILNRSKLFRLLSALAFFSGMVSSADHTLLLYYVEQRLEFDDKDVALMFVIIGVLGIVVQGVVLKPLNDMIGERFVVVVSFLIGTVVNLLYGVATSKSMIFVAISLASLIGMSFPTISAIKSNNVDELEQGRIQGALYSLSALASALGPMFLRFVYHLTKDNTYLGPGTMFIVAACLYLLATFCAYALPKDQANSSGKMNRKQGLLSEGASPEETYGTAAVL